MLPLPGREEEEGHVDACSPPMVSFQQPDPCSSCRITAIYFTVSCSFCVKRGSVFLFQALWGFLLLYLLLWRSAVCSGIFINYCGDAAKRTASLWTTSSPGPSTVLESILFLTTDNLSYFSAQVLYTSGVFLAKI